MVRIVLRVIAAVALLSLACTDDTTGPGSQPSPTGGSIGFEGCKSLMAAQSLDGNDQACISYVYDGQSILQLKHINAVFNCCPDSVGGEVQIDERVIAINEMEVLTMPCDCICPFDVDYEIVDLPPGLYTIRVNEIYTYQDMELLEFTVDLTKAITGDFCVERELPHVAVSTAVSKM